MNNTPLTTGASKRKPQQQQRADNTGGGFNALSKDAALTIAEAGGKKAAAWCLRIFLSLIFIIFFARSFDPSEGSRTTAAAVTSPESDIITTSTSDAASGGAFSRVFNTATKLKDVLVLRTRRVLTRKQRLIAHGIEGTSGAVRGPNQVASDLAVQNQLSTTVMPIKEEKLTSTLTTTAPALSPLLPISELLPLIHPLYPYASQSREYKVSLVSTWFNGDMPYYRGQAVCPASKCRVTLMNRGGTGPEFDVLLYHSGPFDFIADPPPPSRPGQLVALMAAEGFDMAEKSSSYFAKFNSEHSFRATSITRDTYVLWFVNDAHKQGIDNKQRPLRLDARVWEDIWEKPLPWTSRDPLILASWGSSYCKGARSNRETLVRELLAAGIKIAIYGDVGNCLRNVLTPRSSDQYKEMRSHKFYFSFENHRIDGYVTEKVSEQAFTL
jgi:hypothetical protein